MVDQKQQQLEVLRSIAEDATDLEAVRRAFECSHLHAYLRVRTSSSGSSKYVRQCAACGKLIATLRASDLNGEARFATPFAEGQHDEYCKTLKECEEAFKLRKQKQESADWKRQHAELIQSPRWQALRKLVLERCGGKCECCLLNIATQIHHIHYRFPLGKEPLWVLRGVCKGCHYRLYEIGTRD